MNYGSRGLDHQHTIDASMWHTLRTQLPLPWTLKKYVWQLTSETRKITERNWLNSSVTEDGSKSSQVKARQGKARQGKASQVKACRPEGSPFRAQANEMQDFTRSTSVQREKHKILFEPHPMTILKSLHNPVVKAFPNTIFFQRCSPSVGRSSACPSSSDVPMQHPASPTFRRQGCNIRSELPYCLDACDRPRFNPA